MSLKERLQQAQREEKLRLTEEVRKKIQEERRIETEMRKKAKEATKARQERDVAASAREREQKANEEVRKRETERLLLPARKRLENSGIIKILKEAKGLLKKESGRLPPRLSVSLHPTEEGEVHSDSSYVEARLEWQYPKASWYGNPLSWHYISVKAPLNPDSLTIEIWKAYMPSSLPGSRTKDPQKLFHVSLTSSRWRDRNNLEQVLFDGLVNAEVIRQVK